MQRNNVGQQPSQLEQLIASMNRDVRPASRGRDDHEGQAHSPRTDAWAATQAVARRAVGSPPVPPRPAREAPRAARDRHDVIGRSNSTSTAARLNAAAVALVNVWMRERPASSELAPYLWTKFSLLTGVHFESRLRRNDFKARDRQALSDMAGPQHLDVLDALFEQLPDSDRPERGGTVEDVSAADDVAFPPPDPTWMQRAFGLQSMLPGVPESVRDTFAETWIALGAGASHVLPTLVLSLQAPMLSFPSLTGPHFYHRHPEILRGFLQALPHIMPGDRQDAVNWIVWRDMGAEALRAMPDAVAARHAALLEFRPEAVGRPRTVTSARPPAPLAPLAAQVQHVHGTEPKAAEDLSDAVNIWRRAARGDHVQAVDVSGWDLDHWQVANVVTFLNRLLETRDYTAHANARSALIDRVDALLESMENDATQRADLCNMMQDGLGACADRVIYAMNQAEVSVRAAQARRAADPETALRTLARACVRLQSISECAAEIVRLNPGRAQEELEVYLALEVNLRQDCDLPVGAQGLLYGVCAALRPEDYTWVRAVVQEADRDPARIEAFMATWKPWRAYQRAVQVQRFAYEALAWEDMSQAQINDLGVCSITQFPFDDLEHPVILTTTNGVKRLYDAEYLLRRWEDTGEDSQREYFELNRLRRPRLKAASLAPRPNQQLQRSPAAVIGPNGVSTWRANNDHIDIYDALLTDPDLGLQNTWILQMLRAMEGPATMPGPANLAAQMRACGEQSFVVHVFGRQHTIRDDASVGQLVRDLEFNLAAPLRDAYLAAQREANNGQVLGLYALLLDGDLDQSSLYARGVLARSLATTRPYALGLFAAALDHGDLVEAQEWLSAMTPFLPDVQEAEAMAHGSRTGSSVGDWLVSSGKLDATRALIRASLAAEGHTRGRVHDFIRAVFPHGVPVAS